MNLKQSILLLACIAQSTLYTQNFNDPHWDWSAIDAAASTHFPATFLTGFATSAHQVEGNCDNNTWSEWEKALSPDGTPRVEHQSGKACDHWNRYKEDIKLLKETGANTFRFSVEWSKIEPQEGVYSQEALDHYEDVCKELVANDIMPVITLHHYTDPIWFMDKGGFEKSENIHHYVEFCQKTFERLHPYVHLWFTFNSPSGYATKGYLNGTVPPAKKDMQAMAEVFKNLLESHVQTYHALKGMQGGTESKIGILKNIYRIEPANAYNPIDHLGSFLANYITNALMYNFFTTGKFYFYIPGKAYVEHENSKASQSLDFIGLNYYSHAYMSNFQISNHPQETKTQNPMYTLYPEGMYHAIGELYKQIAKPLDIPIYITENGIATDDNDVRREHAQRYLYAVSKAIEYIKADQEQIGGTNKANVKGYIHWALLDNYEWGSYNKKYGVYAVDFDTQERSLKPGADYLINVFKKIRNTNYAAQRTA